MINVKEIANNLITELKQELEKNADSVKLVDGAIKGVNLFYNKLAEAQENQQTETESNSEKQDNKPARSGKKTKSKK